MQLEEPGGFRVSHGWAKCLAPAFSEVARGPLAPSLALILYRSDVEPLFAGRPALELVDRVLPEPDRAAV